MSKSMLKSSKSLLACGCALFAVVAACGDGPDVVYETNDPFGGLFGVYGYDISRDQSVAVRFTPDREFKLDQLRLWLWNNDTQGGHPRLAITLRYNEIVGNDGSKPGDASYETWLIDMPTTGLFEPKLFDFDSVTHLPLHAGESYWIVAESDALGGWDPVWAVAQPGSGFVSLRDPPGTWSIGRNLAVGAVIVLGTPQFARADMNCDGAVDFNDIDPFVTALLSREQYETQYSECNYLNADVDQDGSVDFNDIDGFVQCEIDGGCA